MPSVDAAIIYKRRQYSLDTTTLASFTVPQETYTYTILCELLQGKWVPYWSYKCLNVDYNDQFIVIISKEQTNVAHFYDDEPCTEDNCNEEVQEMASML